MFKTQEKQCHRRQSTKGKVYAQWEQTIEARHHWAHPSRRCCSTAVPLSAHSSIWCLFISPPSFSPPSSCCSWLLVQCSVIDVDHCHLPLAALHWSSLLITPCYSLPSCLQLLLGWMNFWAMKFESWMCCWKKKRKEIIF